MSGSRVISEQQLEQHRSFSGPGLLVGLVGGEAAPAPAMIMIAAGIAAAVGDLVQVGWTALRIVIGEVREVWRIKCDDSNKHSVCSSSCDSNSAAVSKIWNPSTSIISDYMLFVIVHNDRGEVIDRFISEEMFRMSDKS